MLCPLHFKIPCDPELSSNEISCFVLFFKLWCQKLWQLPCTPFLFEGAPQDRNAPAFAVRVPEPLSPDSRLLLTTSQMTLMPLDYSMC